MKLLSQLDDILNVIKTSEMGDDINENYRMLLLSALSEEFNAWYFYLITRPYIIGEHFKDIRNLFEETAKDELEDHAYWLIERINQLGYKIDDIAHPSSWANLAEHKYVKPIFSENGNIDPKTILEQAIQSELDAIATYTNLCEFTNAIKDSTSNLKLRQILADEEEHLSDLKDIYESIKK
jgi:ferritin-like protein